MFRITPIVACYITVHVQYMYNVRVLVQTKINGLIKNELWWFFPIIPDYYQITNKSDCISFISWQRAFGMSLSRTYRYYILYVHVHSCKCTIMYFVSSLNCDRIQCIYKVLVRHPRTRRMISNCTSSNVHDQNKGLSDPTVQIRTKRCGSVAWRDVASVGRREREWSARVLKQLIRG